MKTLETRTYFLQIVRCCHSQRRRFYRMLKRTCRQVCTCVQYWCFKEEKKKVDHVLEYTPEVMSLGLLLIEFDDTIHKGDGNHISRC